MAGALHGISRCEPSTNDAVHAHLGRYRAASGGYYGEQMSAVLETQAVVDGTMSQFYCVLLREALTA